MNDSLLALVVCFAAVLSFVPTGSYTKLHVLSSGCDYWRVETCSVIQSRGDFSSSECRQVTDNQFSQDSCVVRAK
jgi:hypothetical protein